MRFLACFLTVTVAALGCAKDFTMTVLHTNDLHGHVEPTMIRGKGFGGYARHITLINKFRKEDPNVLLLNAGDVFQGTLFFSQYEGLADLVYLNQAKYDAMALGNHEFDRGPQVLANFIERAQFPALCANLDFSDEPSLASKVQPYSVLTVGGQKIGVVGAMTPDLFTLVGPLPSVTMKELIPSVQSAIDSLTNQKVNKIIVLSHCGYGEDLAMAQKLRGADIIVGGHSHTPLGDIKLPGDIAAKGKYPSPTTGADGKPALVIQAWEWGKVFGRLQVTFDDAGHVMKVPSATPIVVDDTIPEDPGFKATVDALAMPIMTLRKTKVASTATGFTRAGSRTGESDLGNLVADAMLAKTSAQGAMLAVMNPGGLRADVEKGTMSVETCINVQPFGNTLVVLDVNLGELKAAFENSSSYFLQVSKGFSVGYDLSRSEGDRVVSMKLNGSQLWPIPPNVRIGNIRIVTNSFLAGGGDKVSSFKAAAGFRVDTGYIDVDALMEYLRTKPEWNGGPENRISVTGKLP